MEIRIASQLDRGFNDRLRARNRALTIIDLNDDPPWDNVTDADALLVVPSPAWRAGRALERPARWPGRVRWVYSMSAGVDGYPGWLLDAPWVSCGRGVASATVADYVLAAIYRRAVDLDAARVQSVAEWRLRRQPPGRLHGATIGIVGLGSIGIEVACRSLALGARVIAVRRRALPSPIEGVALANSLAELFDWSHHIVLALPATDQSRASIDAATLRCAKPTAHLINVARGSVVDQAALIDALDAGRLGFATLDVTEPMPLPDNHRLRTHPKVHLTPHIAAHSAAAWNALFDKVAANLDRFSRGEMPADLVDRAAGY